MSRAIRLCLTRVQAQALDKLIRAQLHAYAEAMGEPGEETAASGEPPAPFTGEDLEAVSALLPGLARF